MKRQTKAPCEDPVDKAPRPSATSHSPRALAQIFLALADPVRLRMLNLMVKGEVNILSLAINLKQDPRVLARHLVYLRRGGLVAVRRKNRACFYFTPANPNTVAFQLLQIALQSLQCIPETELDEVLFEQIQKKRRTVRVAPLNDIPAWDNIAIHANEAPEQSDHLL